MSKETILTPWISVGALGLSMAGDLPPALATQTRHPSLTEDLQQHTPAAIVHSIVGHALVGAPVVCRVSILDLEAQLGTLGVQHKLGSALFHLLSLGSQPEELDGWGPAVEGTFQPGLSPLQHGDPGLCHCQLRGLCGNRTIDK